MGIFVNNLSILESTWFRFIAIANHVNGFSRFSIDKAPLNTRRETGSSTSSQLRVLYFVANGLLLHAHGFLEHLIAAVFHVAIDVWCVARLIGIL